MCNKALRNVKGWAINVKDAEIRREARRYSLQPIENNLSAEPEPRTVSFSPVLTALTQN